MEAAASSSLEGRGKEMCGGYVKHRASPSLAAASEVLLRQCGLVVSRLN